MSEIAEAAGLHKATAHRIIMPLLNCGFLERVPNGEKFRLGLRVVELGLGALLRLGFRQVASPYMQQLVERVGETNDLSIFDRGRILFLEVVHGEHSLTIAARIGRHLPARCTASGKVFLAFLPPVVVESILAAPLNAHKERVITSPVRLREEIEAIRQRGYGIDDDDEYEAGIGAVAASIRNVCRRLLGR